MAETRLDVEGVRRMAELEARQAASLVEFRRCNLAAPDDVEAAPFHEEWSRLLLFGRENEAIEGFRGSAKDQYVFQAYIMYCLKYPAYERCYIVILCATGRIAQSKLLAITRRFQSAECSSMRPHVERVIEDSGAAFQVLYKDGMQVRVEAYGKGASIRGLVWGAKRPDILIMNDPQDLEDMNSPRTLEKDWEWFTSDVIFLGNSTRIFLIANNLGALCIIERVFQHARELRFDCRRYPVLDVNDNSTWPAKEPTKVVLAERDSFRSMGEIDTWMREKMCQVMAEESRPLKPELYEYFDPFAPMEKGGTVIKIVLDPAISEKSDADESVITAAAFRDDGHKDILEMDVARRNPYKIVDDLFRMVSRYDPAMVGIETIAYQEMLAQEIERQQRTRGIYFNVVRIRGMKGRTKTSKEQKIRLRLQPQMAVGAIRLPKGAAWIAPLIEQTRVFPYGAHDDMLETLAMLDDVTADVLIPNFERQTCVTGEFPILRNWPMWCALVPDQQGECAMLFLTCSPEGRLFVTDQIFYRGTPEALYRRYLSITGSRQPIMTAAPSVMFKRNPVNGSVWADSYRAAGFRLVEAPDDYGAALTLLNQSFAAPYKGARPKLQIFNRCKRLIWELYHAVAGEQKQDDRKSIQCLMLLLACGPKWRDMSSSPLRDGRTIRYPSKDVP